MLRFIQLTDFLGYELQTEEASEFVNRKKSLYDNTVFSKLGVQNQVLIKSKQGTLVYLCGEVWICCHTWVKECRCAFVCFCVWESLCAASSCVRPGETLSCAWPH